MEILRTAAGATALLFVWSQTAAAALSDALWYRLGGVFEGQRTW